MTEQTTPQMTTGVRSVSLPVADQDQALAFYTEVLGCELEFDAEFFGTRMISLAVPGGDVSIVLLTPDAQVPIALRLGTASADAAHARLKDSAATVHNDEVLRLEGAPPMFAFADPDGNQLVYLED